MKENKQVDNRVEDVFVIQKVQPALLSFLEGQHLHLPPFLLQHVWNIFLSNGKREITELAKIFDPV